MSRASIPSINSVCPIIDVGRTRRRRFEIRDGPIDVDFGWVANDLREIERVEIRLSDLTTFGTGVRGVRDQVEIVLTEKLRQAAPEISEAMTKAFRALTDHPVYDSLYIDEAQLPQLHMLVASTGDSFPGLVPSEVLNGQAINALELVPYFAFSDLDTFPFEVHLLLLDDPSRPHRVIGA